MVEINEDAKGTAYTVSCDAAIGVSTGISATDRALTARILADRSSTPASITRPGHIFPLWVVYGVVRERPGHTEAAVDLCRLAGLAPVGVIAELVHDDGEIDAGWTACAISPLNMDAPSSPLRTWCHMLRR